MGTPRRSALSIAPPLSCTASQTYAGGARTIEDLELVKEAGNSKVHITVGSALDIFGGALAYKDVVDWHYKQAGTPAPRK